MYLAIAKKQKSAVNVLLFAPTFVKKFAPEFANRPAKEWVNLYIFIYQIYRRLEGPPDTT